MKYKIAIFFLFGVFMVETKVVRDQNKFTKAKLENGYDPGKCNQSNHATFIVVKDRENNDRLLICAEENDVYNWKTTDGSDPTGEFFNPAYDCLKILDKNPEAKDGFYWIKLSGIVPKKIWCDMKTDGGGWILIGRKNSSVTWTVPSNGNPVEPFGEPHWSSSLGDVPILDFRVQMATQEDFGVTRAHWFFRLENKRPLKNLLVVNEGGCGRLSPGIGDISYVKDLQTGKIVTTKFRCSHFGTYYPKSSKYGWDMMNFCLEKPCPLGFAFHHKYSDQIDYSGAFSYSTSSSTSGFTHDSTSFVGCDNRKCCGCFGPVGGTKDYCGVECQARQGGTIAKNIYTWFWVRSSLPKRLWNKCMEYKVSLANGKVVWYKLYKGNAVPILGRCTQKKALLNDGIIVVPDAAAARKVPPVPGLLEYRKDNQKLYIRLNESWSVVGGDEEVPKGAMKQVKPKLDQIEKITMLLNTSLVDLKSQLQNVTDTVRGHIKHEKVWGKTCASLYKSGFTKDGIYTVNPDGLGPFQVRCDMNRNGGGWTVFQRRMDGSVDFYRGWQDYKKGFGHLNGEFWLGLDKIHRLTKSGQNVLRVDLRDFNDAEAYAKYGTFTVASESSSYIINIGRFSGTAGDSLKIHNGMKFSTKDRDNDSAGSHCAVLRKGGWWYVNCSNSNLNGLYLTASAREYKGMYWYWWKSDARSMKRTEMKIRPAQF